MIFNYVYDIPDKQKWLICPDYRYANVETTMRVLEALRWKDHTLLFGVSADAEPKYLQETYGLRGDQLRFSGQQDHSFSVYHKLSHPHLVNWYEYDTRTDLRNLLMYDLPWIITDDTNKLRNFLYYCEVFEVYGVGLALKTGAEKWNSETVTALRDCLQTVEAYSIELLENMLQ